MMYTLVYNLKYPRNFDSLCEFSVDLFLKLEYVWIVLNMNIEY